MPQLITNNLRVLSASLFRDALLDTSNTALYSFIGRSLPWESTPNGSNLYNNQYAEVNTWHDIIALKRINSNDVKLVVPRKNWTTSTVYDQYDQLDTGLNSKNFYVLTSPEYNVYICISNNNGAQSVNKPTSKSLTTFSTADGYKWKYLYSLSDSDILKFLTLNYMPININSDVLTTTVGGTIENFVISSGGFGFASNSAISIKGNGSGFSGSLNLSGNSISSITINEAGAGYTYAQISYSGPGSNANIRPVLSPVLGHGYNIYENLNARYLMINSRFNYAEGGGDVPVVNEFRSFGIIKNPLTPSGQLANAVTMDGAYLLNAEILSGTFSLDEKITGNVLFGNGIVLSANLETPNVSLRYLTPANVLTGVTTFSEGERITGNTSGATAMILNIRPPEVRKYSGKILYIENRDAITRSYDQAENLHIVLEF